MSKFVQIIPIEGYVAQYKTQVSGMTRSERVCAIGLDEEGVLYPLILMPGAYFTSPEDAFEDADFDRIIDLKR